MFKLLTLKVVSLGRTVHVIEMHLSIYVLFSQRRWTLLSTKIDCKKQSVIGAFSGTITVLPSRNDTYQYPEVRDESSHHGAIKVQPLSSHLLVYVLDRLIATPSPPALHISKWRKIELFKKREQLEIQDTFMTPTNVRKWWGGGETYIYTCGKGVLFFTDFSEIHSFLQSIGTLHIHIHF